MPQVDIPQVLRESVSVRRIRGMSATYVRIASLTDGSQHSEVHRLELQVQGLQNSLNILLHSLGPLPALRASDHISDRVVTTAAVDSNTTATTDAETGSPEGGIPSVGHEQQPVKYPQFHGPTSATFPFEHARSSLKERGMNELNTIDEAVDIPSTTSAASMGDNDFDTPAVNEPLLWEIGWSETIRLCRSYTDDYDSVYPLVDMGTLAAKVRSFFNQQSSSRRDLRIRASGVVEPLSQHDVVVLKLILAVSLVAEGSGQSERGQKAFASAQSAIQHAIWQRVSIRNIQILALGVRSVNLFLPRPRVRSLTERQSGGVSPGH